ncbi:hypothetical protein J008_06686 [Cryptococcus neoformans]|uniref:CMP/dCMP-type deaminase domain-containing protein n=2 Tax=Cryptococcus neoformans TaxID=5207 RepID=A0A854Q4Y2_CRYNE|nr:hypothetical protein C362_06662 [Cryptococcus neoformans var. grubii Bt1]OWZ27030.1 hypothetical protein C347_06683 [Cryptococcus neoformans var. grubii AD2-60a]OWZ27861.1 hypothetical protein C353_06715 [Cryptococcus neoformans var. grubii AD1-83a]OWZ38891.1 hypothetical protein C343_06685 [Cryptococcus neoformans var. grubii C23]OWZ50364.1 hypothetical protein C368_06505 [Cryptococcus neoformans var. grubii 125.91]OXC81288.1 hypothetical protein C344_06591 [Cryptococcus neoformans var. gr
MPVWSIIRVTTPQTPIFSTAMVQLEHPEQTRTNSTTNARDVAIMKHCIELSYNCEVSPTAFSVGSTLFLPSSSSRFSILKSRFPSFSKVDGAEPQGLILADGWSRQIPGNTHAEANALANFRKVYGELLEGTDSTTSDLPPIENVLADVSCYATMEPCSVRTSGGPSCALELVRSKINSVYLGVEEPPDFVQCDGVRILQDGNVEVIRVSGLEEECLKAARRGRD